MFKLNLRNLMPCKADRQEERVCWLGQYTIKGYCFALECVFVLKFSVIL